MQGRVSFRRPFTPNSFFAYMLPLTDWVGAPKLTLSPGAGNPRCATVYIVKFSASSFQLAVAHSTELNPV